MKMTRFENFETTVKKDLVAAGLQDFINWKSSQFLDCGSEFFVELVLNEGSKISEAERLLAREVELLGGHNEILDGVVRAAWEVLEIKPLGQVISSNGFPRASKAFIAELKSGNATCIVEVDMTYSAIELLRRKRSGTAHSNGKCVPANEVGAIRRYLEHQLSYGGTSYWNPLKYSRRELNEAGMYYLCSWLLN